MTAILAGFAAAWLRVLAADEIVLLRKDAHGPGPGCRRPHDRGSPEETPRRFPFGGDHLAVLFRRGFVTPQPQKRPRSSFVRFEAQMLNERWQADITHWKLAGGVEVEILNVLDDHSRLLVASEARAVLKAADVVATFHAGAATCGFPATLLTDNGAVFTGRFRMRRDKVDITGVVTLRHNSRLHHIGLGRKLMGTRVRSGGGKGRHTVQWLQTVETSPSW